MTFFSEVGAKILNFSKLIDPGVGASYLLAIKPIAVTVLTIFILWRFIQVMMGGSKQPISQVSKEIVVWAIIFVFVFNSTYLSMVQNGMNEAYTYFGGGTTFFTNLDNWWKRLVKAGEILFEKDEDFVPVRGIFALFIVLLGAFLLNFIPLMLIFISALVMNILVALAPFMLLTLIFPTIKQTFHNWLRLLLTIFLLVLIISFIQASLAKIIDKFTTGIVEASTKAKPGAIVGDSFEILIFCLLYAILYLMALPVARTISGSAHNFVARN